MYTTVTESLYAVNQWLGAKQISEHNVGGVPKGILVAGIAMKVKYGRLVMLQLCVGRRCLIYQIPEYAALLPFPLREFLLDPCVYFVGVDKDEIQDTLVHRYGKIEFEDHLWKEKLTDGCGKWKDLRDLATVRKNNVAFEKMDVLDIAANIPGFPVPPPPAAVAANWAAKFSLANRSIRQVSLLTCVLSSVGLWKLGFPIPHEHPLFTHVPHNCCTMLSFFRVISTFTSPYLLTALFSHWPYFFSLAQARI